MKPTGSGRGWIVRLRLPDTTAHLLRSPLYCGTGPEVMGDRTGISENCPGAWLLGHQGLLGNQLERASASREKVTSTGGHGLPFFEDPDSPRPRGSTSGPVPWAKTPTSPLASPAHPSPLAPSWSHGAWKPEPGGHLAGFGALHLFLKSVDISWTPPTVLYTQH